MVRFRAWNFSAGHLLEPRDGTLQPGREVPQGDIVFSTMLWGRCDFFFFKILSCAVLYTEYLLMQAANKILSPLTFPHVPLGSWKVC